jgi:hypothetical protein
MMRAETNMQNESKNEKNIRTQANVSKTGDDLSNKFQHKMCKRSMSKIDAETKSTLAK